MEFWTHSPAETQRLGETLAPHLRPGQVVALRGGLGAGKTAFTQGLARGMGVTGPVTSPTYTIVNEYAGRQMPLLHFDLYRLQGEEELLDIGWADYLDRGGVCVVEWIENAPEAMAGAVVVTIDPGPGDTRKITIEGVDLNEAFGP